MKFRDFNIEILAKRDDLFDLRVVSSASGELQATITLPRSVDDLLLALQTRGIAVRGAAGDRDFTPVADAAVRPATAIGQELFDLLFSSPAVTRALAECMTDAKNSDSGVRLKLTLNTKDAAVADLARLPWELLHDNTKYKYFALRPDSPIVRYLEVPKPFEVRPLKPPLRILVVSANPRKDLALDKERDNLKAALTDDPNIELTFVDDATIQSIANALARGKAAGRDFHVLHYMGHGDFHHGKGVLLLHKSGGGEDYVDADAFNTALQAAEDIRLVFLNACNTAQSSAEAGSNPFAGVATALVFEGVPAVVAMQRPVPDSAAIVLAKNFYPNIAKGWPVDAAVSEGRRQMFFADRDSLDWAIPVLFMRSPNGALFDIAEPSAPPGPPVPPPRPAPPPAVHVPEPSPEPLRAFQSAAPPAPPSGWSWKRWAATAAGVGTLMIGAIVWLATAAEPARVVLLPVPPSIEMGSAVEAHLQLFDRDGILVEGEALAKYDVDWTASTEGIVTITNQPPVAGSKAVVAEIRGVRAPADKAPVTVTATLRQFPELKDSRQVTVVLSTQAKDDFRDAYRAARAQFDDPSVDDATVAAAHKTLLESSGWIVGYVDELPALRADEKAGVRALPATAKALDSAVAAFKEALNGDGPERTIVEREAAWKSYVSAWESVRGDSPALKTARERLAALDGATKAAASVVELRTCPRASVAANRCTRAQAEFRTGDQVAVSVVWKTPSTMPGRDRLSFEWGPVGADGRLVAPRTLETTSESGRDTDRTWWGVFTATAGGAHQLRVKNGRGDLVWRQAVSVR